MRGVLPRSGRCFFLARKKVFEYDSSIMLREICCNVLWRTEKSGYCKRSGNAGVPVCLRLPPALQRLFQRGNLGLLFGKPFTEETEEEILRALRPSYIHGLTVLGGEPFEPENQPAVLGLLKKVRAAYPEKTIWCFTGDTLETDLLREGGCGRCAVTDELLAQLDVLVDGPFIAAQRNLMLRFRGSENQRLIDLKSTLKNGRVVLWEES